MNEEEMRLFFNDLVKAAAQRQAEEMMETASQVFDGEDAGEVSHSGMKQILDILRCLPMIRLFLPNSLKSLNRQRKLQVNLTG